VGAFCERFSEEKLHACCSNLVLKLHACCSNLVLTPYVRARWSEVGQSYGQSLCKNIDVRFDDDLSTVSRELKVPD